MAIARFDSLVDCDLVEVEFVGPDGDRLASRLFVDSGFTARKAPKRWREKRNHKDTKAQRRKTTGAVRLRSSRLRVFVVRLDGEADFRLWVSKNAILFTIQARWMGPKQSEFFGYAYSSPSCSPSAQGGWGPGSTNSESTH